MKNLFINAVSANGILILFNEKREIFAEEKIEILGNESSKLIEKLDVFLKKEGIEYKDLDNIVVVNGPGSFTGVRTITLLVNTIGFAVGVNITPMNFFELYHDYPIIKPSSKRDVFFQKDQNSEIEILLNTDLQKYVTENNIKNLYWENIQTGVWGVQILDNIDYIDIIKNIEFQKTTRIEPLYKKRPNIS